MAGIEAYFDICAEDRVATGWSDESMNYRSNIVTRVGGMIPLHTHSYDHHARITGIFDVEVIEPKDKIVGRFVAKTGDVLFIPGRHAHRFTLKEPVNGVGVVLCYWPKEQG